MSVAPGCHSPGSFYPPKTLSPKLLRLPPPASAWAGSPRASNHFVLPPALPCCWYYPTLFTWNEGCYFDHLLHLDLNTFPNYSPSPKYCSARVPCSNDLKSERPDSSRFVISIRYSAFNSSVCKFNHFWRFFAQVLILNPAIHKSLLLIYWSSDCMQSTERREKARRWPLPRPGACKLSLSFIGDWERFKLC